MGYGFFAMTSTMGSHPGLSVGAMLASADEDAVANMSRNQVPLHRAFVVMAQMRAFRHVACDDLRYGEDLADWLDAQREIDVALSNRFRDVTWPEEAT
jgi:hypothetical protein